MKALAVSNAEAAFKSHQRRVSYLRVWSRRLWYIYCWYAHCKSSKYLYLSWCSAMVGCLSCGQMVGQSVMPFGTWFAWVGRSYHVRWRILVPFYRDFGDLQVILKGDMW